MSACVRVSVWTADGEGSQPLKMCSHGVHQNPDSRLLDDMSYAWVKYTEQGREQQWWSPKTREERRAAQRPIVPNVFLILPRSTRDALCSHSVTAFTLPPLKHKTSINCISSKLGRQVHRQSMAKALKTQLLLMQAEEHKVSTTLCLTVGFISHRFSDWKDTLPITCKSLYWRFK